MSQAPGAQRQARPPCTTNGNAWSSVPCMPSTTSLQQQLFSQEAADEICKR